MNNKNPLLDKQFLYELDYNHNKITYVRITSLTFDDYPVEQIEGVVTEGSINLDGTSSVRRTCSLTLTTNNLNINNIYWSLATKIKIEIGIENNLFNYKQYPNIIWFSQGIFILTDFSPSAQVDNYTIKITAKDKMCLINGDIGGIFNAETQLDSERIYNDDGTYKDEKKSLEYIIKELIHNYALEEYHNIIIKGLDELQKRILRNNSNNVIYLIKNYKTGEIVDIASSGSINSQHQYYYKNQQDLLVNFKIFKTNFIFESDDLNLIEFEDELQKHPTFIIRKENTDEENINYVVSKLESGSDIGYELVELFYPTELIAGVGETVTSILDKIIKTFGIYEYFYNVNGQFVFQPKTIYVNHMWNDLYELDNEYYIPPEDLISKVSYKFEGSQIITTYTSNPQIGKIKNDFTVWGKKTLSSGGTVPIHIRYSIDIKPLFYTTFLNDENIKENYISKEFYNIIKKEYKYINKDTKIFNINNNTNINWVLIQKNVKTIDKKILSLYDDNYLISNFFINTNDKLYLLSQIEAEKNTTIEYQAIFNNQKSSQELKTQTINKINKLLNYYYEFYEITDWRELIYQMAKDYQKHRSEDNYNILLSQNNNKNFLRKDNLSITMRPYEKGKTGYEQYYTDLLGFWRTLYLPEKELKGIEANISKNKSFININDFYSIQTTDNFVLEKKFIGPWNQNIINAPSNLIFWFDFFDANDIDLGQFSVPAIGNRPKNEVNDNVQALIYNNVPEIIYIEANDYQDFLKKGWISNNNKLVNGYNYIINSDIFSQFLGDGRISVSNTGMSGYEIINDLLYNNAYSNEQINISCIPIYYLEPNSIISVLDQERGINGLYIINTISLPLSYSGTMTINAIKVPANLK